MTSLSKFFSRKEVKILMLILVASAFFRLYKLSEMANFDFDQEHASNFAYSVIREFPIQLIGQDLSVKGLFMGPLYFYFLVPFFWLFNLHPLGGALGSVVFGLITIVVYYVCLKNIFGVKVGLLAAFFRGILMSKVNTDWSMSPAFSSDLIVVLTLYFFWRFWRGHDKSLIMIGALFGLYTSIHPILFPLYFVFIALILIKKPKFKIKTVILSAFGMAATTSSLIVFEVIRKFWDLKTFLNYTSGGSSEVRNFQKVVELLKTAGRDFNFTLTFGYNNFSVYLIPTVVFIVFVILIYKKTGFWKESFHRLFFILTLLLSLVYYFLLPSHTTEYYFQALTTLTFVYLIATLGMLKNKTIVFVLILTIIFNLVILTQRWKRDDLSTLYHKDQIVKKILSLQPKEEQFYVSYIKYLGWDNGFNYFFKLYGRSPQTKDIMQPIYTIVVPKHLIKDGFGFESGNIRLIYPKALKIN